VRGASALDRWVGEHRGVEAFVVWEPVLEGDVVPGAGKLAGHAHNYWDPGRTRSAVMKAGGGGGVDAACLASGSAELDVVWDAVFDYAAGADAPGWCGRTILEALPRMK
jgi:hypothetical protein